MKIHNFEEVYLRAPMDFDKVLGHFRCLRNLNFQLVYVLSESGNFGGIGRGLCMNTHQNSKIRHFLYRTRMDGYWANLSPERGWRVS